MIKVNCKSCNKEIEVTKRHYNRNITKGYNFCCNNNECKNGTIKYRFWSKVNKKTDDKCWEWLGAKRNKNGFGYGVISYKGKNIDAHRVSYQITNGDINNSKLFVCHKCDNPICVNPNHLFLGTHIDNMRDCLDKGRMVIPEGIRFKKGSIPANSILSKETVLCIKGLIEAKIPIQEIANLFGVSRYKISDIKRGRSYINY